jgi:peptide/nickel transport system ATP-binding protein
MPDLDETPVLSVRDLNVRFGRNSIPAVSNVSFDVGRERIGIVGESGSGKSTTGRAIMRLLPQRAGVTAERMDFLGSPLLEKSERQMGGLRGKDIALIMQDPRYSLNPVLTIGKQVAEAAKLHLGARGKDAVARARDMLARVRINDPDRVLSLYPHQISGGMGQRVMIAMMLAPDPELLIADEPTTALDVTVQEGILRLLISLSEQRQMSVLFVSHDLGVIRFVCDRVAVIYGGHVVETGRVEDVVANPRHRYTNALLAANPGMPKEGNFSAFIGQRLQTIPGSVPPIGNFPTGCRFRNRCAYATGECTATPPPVTVGNGHRYSCWNPAVKD